MLMNFYAEFSGSALVVGRRACLLIVICSTVTMVTPHQYGDNAKLDGEYEILTDEEV
jgi:hypothetical protein